MSCLNITPKCHIWMFKSLSEWLWDPHLNVTPEYMQKGHHTWMLVTSGNGHPMPECLVQKDHHTCILVIRGDKHP